MPKVKKNYFEYNQFVEKTGETKYPTSNNWSPAILEASSNAPKQNQRQSVKADISYGNNTKELKPSEIFNSIKKLAPSIVGDCGVTEDSFLEIFKTELISFLSAGSHKWNFLTIEQTVILKPGQKHYDLPSNYDQMISVYFEEDCKFLSFPKKTEAVFVDAQQKNFLNGVMYYTIVNNRLQFLRTDLNKYLLDCNYCGHCNHCSKMSGTVKLYYHTTPPIPEDIDTPMRWFPKHPAAEQYFIYKIMNSLYVRANQAPSASADQFATRFFDALESWDSNPSPIQNKHPNDRELFDFSSLHSRRTNVRRYHRGFRG